MKGAPLSPRLRAFLSHALPGEPLWDLCCDHGLLGLAALRSGDFPRVHFVDSSPAAMARLRGKALGEEASCWGRPAQELDVELTGTVVIAGVGGLLIWKILQELRTKRLLEARRLVLGPHKNESWLEDKLQGEFAPWSLTLTGNVLERGRSRKLIVLDHSLKKEFA